MHFTGQIWRPPFEANSVLLQATVGCSHNNCKFCTLYHGTPFRVAPFEEIEHDLKIVQKYQPHARRVFLTGANPLVLSQSKLVNVLNAIHDHLPDVQTIGSFARITDVKRKSDDDLKELHRLGYDRIMIGIESGDDTTLEFMRKGFTVNDIIEQCLRLDAAGIEYNFFYLIGLSGAGNGERAALAGAEVISKLRPFAIEILSLTLFPESDLYLEVQRGAFAEASEYERIEELKTLIANIHSDAPTTILANTVSNPVPIVGRLPEDRQTMLAQLQSVLDNVGEDELARYRDSIISL